MNPYFLCLGAQKSGTSWLYSCLNEHPEICIPNKDIHFFSRERNWKKGFDWYLNGFDSCNKNTKWGEISTSYLYSSKACKLIEELTPDVFTFVVLRNPIERAVSHFNNDIKSGKVEIGTSFANALKEHPEYIANSYFKKYIESYLLYVPAGRFKIILYDDVCLSPDKVLIDLFEYLKVKSSFVPSFLNRRVNEARVPQSFVIDKTFTVISKLLCKMGGKKLIWYLKKNGFTQLLRKLNTKNKVSSNSEITTKLKQQLNEEFEADILWLEEYLGKDLSVWRN